MLESGARIEKYEVISAMGSGGMAHVYKVRHVLLGSFHALKVLDAQLVEDPDLRARFLAEGQIQAQLRHPNIVAVTDIIAQPGIAGLVADFVDGPSLELAIRTHRSPPTPASVKAVFLPLLDGLQYAHEHGIVHRDIKPSNIVLDQGRAGQFIPRLLDFGIAKIAETSSGPGQGKGKTRTGTRMGTLHYMSPEQVRGQSDVDGRADIFSMAVTLFEFISGQVPFEADSDFDTMKQIVEGHPTPIRNLQRDVDPILEACVIKGLARDRESRFQSCGEFAALLRQAGNAVPEIPGMHGAVYAAPVSVPPIALYAPASERGIQAVARWKADVPEPPPSDRSPPVSLPPLYASASEPHLVQPARDPNLIYPDPKQMDPGAAAMANLCCLAGLGQMALGQLGKGCVILVSGIALSTAFGVGAVFVVWPLGAIDAYLIAKKLKEGRPVGKWEWF